mgnify:CR=1 FL=1
MVKRLTYILLVLLLVSCGARRGYFKIEGRFLHINQGELYIYSPDGGIDGIDTILIEAGRFAYETPMPDDATLMLVFPNFSVHPVFAESGGSVNINADASHLKEMTVTGTGDNELMSTFRKLIANVSPPEEKSLAEQFIKDHPDSRVSFYLLMKYFVQVAQPDYEKALNLLKILKQEQPRNGDIIRQSQLIETYQSTSVKHKLPKFSAVDVNGKKITDADFSKGKAIISVWAQWNYDGQEMQRVLRSIKDKQPGTKILSICADPSKATCKSFMESNQINWPVVCDEKMLEGELLQKLGFAKLPDIIILENGIIKERNVNIAKLKEQTNKPK